MPPCGIAKRCCRCAAAACPRPVRPVLQTRRESRVKVSRRSSSPRAAAHEPAASSRPAAAVTFGPAAATVHVGTQEAIEALQVDSNRRDSWTGGRGASLLGR